MCAMRGVGFLGDLVFDVLNAVLVVFIVWVCSGFIGVTCGVGCICVLGMFWFSGFYRLWWLHLLYGCVLVYRLCVFIDCI